MRFEVADVTSNIKYIRNGDYGPKRGGLRDKPPCSAAYVAGKPLFLRSFFIVRSCAKRDVLLTLNISYLDPKKKLFILCHWKSHTSE